MTKINNQQGFGLIEVPLILILVAVVGFAGWYIGNNNSKDNEDNKDTIQTTRANKDPSSTNKDKKASVDDKQLIIDAVKTKNPDFPSIGVTVQEIQGNFARGTAGSSEEGGFAYIAKKENGTWGIVFQGQEAASKADGEKYGLPAGWYTTEY